MCTFGSFGGECCVEMERVVGHDGRLERRRNSLVFEQFPIDGREERVALQLGHAFAVALTYACIKENK